MFIFRVLHVTQGGVKSPLPSRVSCTGFKWGSPYKDIRTEQHGPGRTGERKQKGDNRDYWIYQGFDRDAEGVS